MRGFHYLRYDAYGVYVIKGSQSAKDLWWMASPLTALLEHSGNPAIGAYESFQFVKNSGNETKIIMKHQYIQLSDFLIDFISDRGGVMSVFNSATVIG